MLTRIYGIAFPKRNQLEEYLALQEEIKRRDHRKLGKDLDLFALLDEGPGFPFFLPKGMILKNLLIDYWREVHQREGYLEISTPIVLNQKLWQTSGHWDYYRENMYTTVIDDMDYAIKPMNCPGGMLIYKQKPHSYKELPIRMGELGLVHRHEKSGALHGLMRVRSFTQDDAHIFMTEEQITDEIAGVIRLIDEVYKKFGFKYSLELSTRPQKSIGILIEHYAGKFPLWLAPVQVKILPISDRFISYSNEVMRELKEIGIRCEIDSRSEKIGYKIREAQLDKVPYMIVVGQKELEEKRVSVRKRDVGDLGSMERTKFIDTLKSERKE